MEKSICQQKVAKIDKSFITDVVIDTGNVDVREEYNKYSIAIHTSPKETGPLVLLEYLSAGIPFIAYNTGSVAAAVSKELPILFVDNFESQRWQKQIETIKEDSSLTNKMQALYRRAFTTEQYLNKCLDIYKSVHS